MRVRSVILVCIGLSLSVFLFIYGPAVSFLIRTKWKFRNSPDLWIVPKPLSLPPSPAAGGTVSYFGYEFTSPLPKPELARKADYAVVLNFSDCAGMAIFRPSPETEPLAVLRQQAAKGNQDVVAIFGADATRSGYALRSKILNLTPANLQFFSSRQEMVADSILLTIKAIDSKRFENGLYSFDTAQMRGFQEGNLSTGAVIQAFDAYDHILTLTVRTKPGASCFTQSDLNLILASLRPASAP